MENLSSNGHWHNNKIYSISNTRFVLHQYLCYLIYIILLRLRKMHRTMPWAHRSLSLVTQLIFILKILTKSLEDIWHMKRNCMPLCKPLSNGDTTFFVRKHSFSLAINLYSSPFPSQNYRQLDNSSGLITCNNFS